VHNITIHIPLSQRGSIWGVKLISLLIFPIMIVKISFLICTSAETMKLSKWNMGDCHNHHEGLLYLEWWEISCIPQTRENLLCKADQNHKGLPICNTSFGTKWSNGEISQFFWTLAIVVRFTNGGAQSEPSLTRVKESLLMGSLSIWCNLWNGTNRTFQNLAKQPEEVAFVTLLSGE